MKKYTVCFENFAGEARYVTVSGRDSWEALGNFRNKYSHRSILDVVPVHY